MNFHRAAFLAYCILSIHLGFGKAVSADGPSPTAAQFNRNYTYIYFENGYPTRLSPYRRPESDANTAARANPDLVIQTGYYSLKLDCDDMQLSGYDALEGSDYLAALTQDVTVFSPADLQLQFDKDGATYRCTSAIVQERGRQYVRLIESGRYVQRFDHLGLVFTSDRGDVLEKAGRLEVTAWPDHVVFTLDVSDVPGITETSIRLTSPSGKTFEATAEAGCAHIAIQPHLDRKYEQCDAPLYIVEASAKKDEKTLPVQFDEAEYGIRIDLPLDRVAFPADEDRVDEFVLEVANPTNETQHIPLIFNEPRPQAITGTCMVLCEEQDGRPTGVPVQISKNWHRKPEERTLHEGPWLRGYTMASMPPGESKRLRLRLVYGFWGDAAAVSHSQLSVIGYGGNWKWDESALGCWGESMTYDPSLHLGAAFIDDVRPAFTTSKSGAGTYNWTENVGGGDFLVYCDHSNTFRWGKRLKTAYRWTGPNMTEVLYSGVTDDDKIRFCYRVRSVRTNDYHRRFHAWRYDFIDDVKAPKRLVFHQMAADFYRTVDFKRFFRGDENGLRSAREREHDVQGYSGVKFEFDRVWLAIDDVSCNDRPDVTARRGLLSLSSTLNGRPFPGFMHLFGTTRGRETMLFDLSSDSTARSYSAGDVVAGELEFILPPKSIDDYWGPDREFADRLKSHSDNAWKLVADEYKYNVHLSLAVHKGVLINNYPIDLRVEPRSGQVLADFTINQGGIGHVPVILRGAPAGSALQAEQFLNGAWGPIEGADLERHDYYQAVRNSNGDMDCVFNIIRPTGDVNSEWRIRISICE